MPSPSAIARLRHYARQVHPTNDLGASRRIIAVDLITEIRRLDKRIGVITDPISTRVEDFGSTLTTITGVGALTAGRILASPGTSSAFPVSITLPLMPGQHHESCPRVT